MAMRDLVPWNSRGREVSGRRDEEPHPILSLHRQMNRLFEDVFRGFDLSPFNMDRWNGTSSWPRIEISESEKEVQVTAELPGLEEKDIEVELEKGVLAIRGEKKTETEDKDKTHRAGHPYAPPHHDKPHNRLTQAGPSCTFSIKACWSLTRDNELKTYVAGVAIDPQGEPAMQCATF